MEYRLMWGGDPEDLLVAVSGTATIDELDAWDGWLRTTLSDPRWRPPMRVLLDQRLLDLGQMGAERIRKRADQSVAYVEQLGRSRVAAVLSRSLEFGLMRMEQAEIKIRANPGFEFEVFRSIEEARGWLQQAIPEDLSSASLG